MLDKKFGKIGTANALPRFDALHSYMVFYSVQGYMVIEGAEHLPCQFFRIFCQAFLKVKIFS
jgi:hypothetical protein